MNTRGPAALACDNLVTGSYAPMRTYEYWKSKTMITSVLSALSEPTRIAAMEILSDGGEHCVCELMKRLGASQSRMSRHMQTLKYAGLVVDRRDAQWVRYRLNPAMDSRVRAVVDAVLAARAADVHEREIA